MSTRLLLIRHGQSIWNAERRWQGHADPPLSPLGREQAGEAARALSEETLHALYASDLRRAVETAEIVGAPHGLTPVLDARLRELSVGAWEGLTRAEIEARWPAELAAFDAERARARPVGGESLAELARRVAAALDEICSRHRGETLAVVAHGGVLAAVTGAFGHENAAVVPVEWPLRPVAGG